MPKVTPLNGHAADVLPPSPENKMGTARKPPSNGQSRLVHLTDETAELPALAREADLIAAIDRDIAALGVVGEVENARMIYVTGTSRILNHPLRLIYRGPSSAGKSFTTDTTISLFPPEAVIEATSLTPQALYYGPPGWLEHKLLKKGEREHRSDDEAADKTSSVRQLISENRIAKQVTVKVGNDFQTKAIEQNGPIAYIETTTAKTVFVEDLNRCLQIFPDESTGQTKRILCAAAGPYLAETEAVDERAIKQRHHEFQRSLQYVDIRIPFAMKLAAALPADKLEARRAVKMVLATVEAIAFIHQHHRERDAQGRLIATAEDYALARRLLLPSLNESLGHGNRAQKTYEKLQRAFPNREFNSTEVLNTKVFMNKMSRDRALKELADLDVLKQVSPGKAKTPARWGWTGKVLKPALPPVESVVS